MENINQIKKRINCNEPNVKKHKILKVFNIILIILMIGVCGLIYCKVDEKGTIIKKIFNVDADFTEFNEKIEDCIDTVFFRKSDVEAPVADILDYVSLGDNKYVTSDNTINALLNGKVVSYFYQKNYEYFVIVNYENGVTALYTEISEMKVENNTNLLKNDIIGVYDDTFQCVFKKNDQILTYEEAFKNN